jgi:uncharacterized membrane protein YbhN (UPF0104 family)
VARRGRAAGRQAGGLITSLEIFLRLAGAIALDTLALVVWNVGTRSLGTMLRDIARAARSPRSLSVGIFSTLVGLVFVAAGIVLLLPAVGDAVSEFVPIEIFTFLVALGLEHIVGNDLRTLAARLGGLPKAQ